jgi:HSP20 family protein
MTNEMKAVDKVSVQTPGESTRECPCFVPRVDIYESAEKITLLADMPGVTKDGVSIDLKDNVLTLRGAFGSPTPAPARVLYKEYEEGDFYRQFTLSNLIDQTRITAGLKDGVLTLELPKVEKAKPRQIEIRTE